MLALLKKILFSPKRRYALVRKSLKTILYALIILIFEKLEERKNPSSTNPNESKTAKENEGSSYKKEDGSKISTNKPGLKRLKERLWSR